MAGESKTEKATDKKRRDERKRGNIFMSRDVVTLASLLVMFFSIKILFPFFYGQIKEYMVNSISKAGNTTSVTNTFVINGMIEFMLMFLKLAVPLLIISMLVSIVATMFQTKMLFVTEGFKPKFNRLSPLQGIKKIISIRSVVEIVKGLIKITILLVILFQYIKSRIVDFPRLMSIDLISSVTYILSTVMGMIINIGIAFAAVSVFDYFYQWWDYERQIKMSKEEIKEEYKQLEGDPKIKGKIKENQRKIAMSRMMQSVPTADVVIKNPTHFAVALKYDMEKGVGAPVVVAKGQDELALRIIKVAEENNIYVIENKPLARAIYAAVDINMQIPADYYGAVAEILVYVYKLKNKL